MNADFGVNVPKKGEKFVKTIVNPRTRKIERIECVVEEVRENKTTDGTPGAVIIVCRGRLVR